MHKIRFHVKNSVGYIGFNRPERKNAFDDEMYVSFREQMGKAARDPEISVIVLHGSDGNFSAGNDLDGFLENPPRTPDSPVFSLLSALATFSKPIVAAVEGVAVGVGTTMLLHCDFVFAAENARFSLPFVKLGLVPEGASSLILPQICGHRRAAEVLLLGEQVTAQHASDMGIVTRVLPTEGVFDCADSCARRLASLPSGSVRETKALMKRGANQQVHVLEQIEHEVAVFSRRIRGPAMHEAIEAFRQKRSPDFTNMD